MHDFAIDFLIVVPGVFHEDAGTREGIFVSERVREEAS